MRGNGKIAAACQAAIEIPPGFAENIKFIVFLRDLD
jgi:hypothetical protein